MNKIQLIQEDITKLNVDAIVNAANTSLLGGGGVDGAIHKAAGKELLETCKRLNGCRTGEAKITPGFKLPARYIIHTVGPVWQKGAYDEENLLKSCYLKSLQIANSKMMNTVAFPNISTGVYGFPKTKAAKIAIKTVKEYLLHYQYPKKVYFVCFDNDNFKIYKELLK